LERWLIVAPPGVGKSRLLRELADRIAAEDRHTQVWRSRARPESVSPFDPIARLLLDALGAAGRDSAGKVLSDALRTAGVADIRAQVVAEACLSVVWPPASSPDDAGKPADERESLFSSWLQGLDALGAGATQVWVVEDVHWAGGDVLAFLDFATSHGSRRLIVATARPSLLETSAEWAVAEEAAGKHTMQLAVLEPTDAAALVTALVGDALPPALVERIAERSDGNCLFIEELLRTWVSVGTLAPGERGGWRLTVPMDEIPLPQSVQSIYAAQLDDLPPHARQLARRASVAGRRFPVGALEPLGADAPHGLEPLQRRELVVGPVTEPLWGEAFAYRHALLRDAGYASLARAERARLHVRLARWLEEAAGERSAEIAEQIAGHYSSALESAPSLAREVDDGLDRDAVSQLSADWYERAGQGTLSMSAHDAARQLFRRSIELTTEDKPLEKARRWERLGDATAFAADMDEGAAAYQKAIELYRTAMDIGSKGFDTGSSAMSRASDMMAGRVEWLARISPEGAKGLAEGAAELRRSAEEMQEGKRSFQEGLMAGQAGLARATASLADVWYQQLRFAEARDLAASTMSELGPIDPASEARLLLARAHGTMGAQGLTPQVDSDIQRAIDLAHQTRDERIELMALEALASAQGEKGANDAAAWREVEDAAIRAGEWATAVEAAMNVAIMSIDTDAHGALATVRRARETALAHGMTEEVGWADYVETEIRFLAGEWDAAAEIAGRAMALAEQNAYRRLHVRTIHVAVPIAAARGDRAVLQHAQRFYDSLGDKFEFPDSPYSRVIRVAQDIELAAHGLRPPVEVDVDSRIASFEDDPSGPSWSAAIDRVVRFWIEEGRVADAKIAVEAMTAALPRFPFVTPLGFGMVELTNGRVALATGDAASAAARALAAVDRFRMCPAPWWIAKALRLLERAGAADREQIAQVERIERSLGAIAPTP
jgi:hypothetical protein